MSFMTLYGKYRRFCGLKFLLLNLRRFMTPRKPCMYDLIVHFVFRLSTNTAQDVIY